MYIETQLGFKYFNSGRTPRAQKLSVMDVTVTSLKSEGQQVKTWFFPSESFGGV